MIDLAEADATFKICIFGEGGVGKTTLTHKYLTKEFDFDSRITLGANIFVNYLDIENKNILLQIWDFGGEDQFRFLLPLYSQGSSGGIFMFDLTRRGTLKSIEDFLNTFKSGLNQKDKSIPILLIGGKSDLIEKRSVQYEEAIQIQKSQESSNNLFEYIECSSKTGDNVDTVFRRLVIQMMKRAKII